METSVDESSPSRSTTNHETNQIANAIRNSEPGSPYDHVIRLTLSPNGRNDLESLPKQEVYRLWFMVGDAEERYYGELNYEDLERFFDLLFDVENTSKGLSFSHIEHKMNRLIHIDDETYDFLSRMVEHVNNNSSESVLGNENGNTLLHAATLCQFKSSEVISLLHDINPNWIWHQNNNLELPLHTVFHNTQLLTEEECNCVRTLLKLNPHAAKVKNKQGKLPFHILCEYSTPIEIPDVRLLELAYEAHPLAVETKVPSEQFEYEYPLHFLFRYYTRNYREYPDPRVTCFVLEKFPKCIFLQNGIGLTPFQVINDDFGTDGITQTLNYITGSEHHLEQILSEMRDSQNGNNILHAISTRTFTDEAAHFFQLDTTSFIFQELMDIFPNLVVQENDQGDLPIQVLLQNNGTRYEFEEVEALAETYDKYCDEHDITNCLDCPPNVTDGTTDGNEYPLILAASQNDACLSTIYYLATRFVARRGGFIL